MRTENNDIYQWGSLFKNQKVIDNDHDMNLIESKELFEGKEIIEISCKNTIAGAIVKV